MRKVSLFDISSTAAIVAVSFSVLLILFWQKIVVFSVDLSENVAYAFDASPERAYSYGERHLDAQDQTLYDIQRASYFFNLAAAKDPTLPYVYHELARIDFLEGRYREALAKIDFQISLHGDTTPNSYYIRGLIEGYMHNYDAASRDYAHFLEFDPHDWAAINDYAWILLKLNRPQDAEVATAAGLIRFPDNPWLLNTNAIALYELGALVPAREKASEAAQAAQSIDERDWLHAYPGNDPLAASQGIATLQQATLDTMHSISRALSSSTLQLH